MMLAALLPWLLLAAGGGRGAVADPSCCKKHTMPFIPDLGAMPPDVHLGQPRRIRDPDPENVRPEGWDDDDDGEWMPNTLDNPEFGWQPPLVPNPDFKPPELLDSLQTEVRKAVPWLVLGVIVTAAMEAMQLWRTEALVEHLRRAGPLQGAAVGLLTPLCACGSSLPVAAGFVAGGVPLGTVVAFLTATQSAGLDSAAVTWGLLGPAAALWRLGGAVFLSLAAGLAVPTAAARPEVIAATAKAPELGKQPGGAGARGVLAAMFNSAVDSATDVFPTMFLGLCLCTTAVHFAPKLGATYQKLQILGSDEAATTGDGDGDGLLAVGMAALGSVLTRLAVLAATLPLQLCEYTTVTYAAAIQKAGGAPGLAFAFLLVGPATNVPSLLLLLRAGREDSSRAVANTARVAAALTLAALVVSYAVDAAGVDLLVERQADKGMGKMMALPGWYVSASPWIAASLALAAVGVKVRRGGAHHDACCGCDTDDDGPESKDASAGAKSTKIT
jgi:uncharacterized membrane protein YraQ (UPF0718 family)